MSDRLPPPPAREPDVADDFADGPDPALWVTSYLAHWTTPERAEARYTMGGDGLVLRIEADQQDWRPEDAPLRVSNLQTGSFSGPLGSRRGTHRHRADGLTVRTAVPTRLLWAPHRGRVDITVSASTDPGCMVAAWLVGTEHESEEDRGEICLFEIDARPGATGWTARCGIKAHGDERLRTNMVEVALDHDARTPHTWTAIWGDGETIIGCDGAVVFRATQSPQHPMFLMIDLFELGQPAGEYPKTATVHSLRGWGAERGPVNPLRSGPGRDIPSRSAQKEDDMSDPVSNDLHDDDGDDQNTQGTPGADEEADTASGGAPEEPDED